MPTADTGLRAAAALLAFNGLGFGLPGLYGLYTFATGQGIARVIGFPTYGEGPFERVGIPTSVPLLGAFVLFCALEVVAAWMVWDGRRAGGILALALLVPGLVFWWGFALPFGPILALPQAALLLLRWKELG